MSYQSAGGGYTASQSEELRNDVVFGILETACSIFTTGLFYLSFAGL